MNDMTSILLALGLVWIINLTLSGFQTKRFHQRVIALRKHGTYTAVGQSGTNIKLKQYVVLVVDEDEDDGQDRVVVAERLSGVTVFASLKPVPQLVGMSLDDIENGEKPASLPEKTWSAAKSSVGFIRNAQKHQGEDDEESEFADSGETELNLKPLRLGAADQETEG
ncbi:MAG: transcriptional regulator GutM [Spirochaetota bacterium]